MFYKIKSRKLNKELVKGDSLLLSKYVIKKLKDLKLSTEEIDNIEIFDCNKQGFKLKGSKTYSFDYPNGITKKDFQLSSNLVNLLKIDLQKAPIIVLRFKALNTETKKKENFTLRYTVSQSSVSYVLNKIQKSKEFMFNGSIYKVIKKFDVSLQQESFSNPKEYLNYGVTLTQDFSYRDLDKYIGNTYEKMLADSIEFKFERGL